MKKIFLDDVLQPGNLFFQIDIQALYMQHVSVCMCVCLCVCVCAFLSVGMLHAIVETRKEFSQL